MTSSIDAEYRLGHGGHGGNDFHFDSPSSKAHQLGERYLSSGWNRQVDCEGKASEAEAAAAASAAVATVLSKGTTGRSVPFPRRLFMMIRREAIRHPEIVRWSADGRAFFVDDDEVFVNKVLPQYGFKASKMQSFQRNLNIYGFSRPSKGVNASGYVHPEFGRDVTTEQLEWIQRDMNKVAAVSSASSVISAAKKSRLSERSCSSSCSQSPASAAPELERALLSSDPSASAASGFPSSFFPSSPFSASPERPTTRSSTFQSLIGGHSTGASMWGGNTGGSAPSPRHYNHSASFSMTTGALSSPRGKRKFSMSSSDESALFTPTSVDRRIAAQYALDETLPKSVLMMVPCNFWALPHAAYTESSSSKVTSTVCAPAARTHDRMFDRLFVKRCKPLGAPLNGKTAAAVGAAGADGRD